jgi:hypothetical protein
MMDRTMTTKRMIKRMEIMTSQTFNLIKYSLTSRVIELKRTYTTCEIKTRIMRLDLDA